MSSTFAPHSSPVHSTNPLCIALIHLTLLMPVLLLLHPSQNLFSTLYHLRENLPCKPLQHCPEAAAFCKVSTSTCLINSAVHRNALPGSVLLLLHPNPYAQTLSLSCAVRNITYPASISSNVMGRRFSRAISAKGAKVHALSSLLCIQLLHRPATTPLASPCTVPVRAYPAGLCGDVMGQPLLQAQHKQTTLHQICCAQTCTPNVCIVTPTPKPFCPSPGPVPFPVANSDFVLLTPCCQGKYIPCVPLQCCHGAAASSRGCPGSRRWPRHSFFSSCFHFLWSLILGSPPPPLSLPCTVSEKPHTLRASPVSSWGSRFFQELSRK